jgi:MOSC domain-containing protein YiiM
LTQENKQGNVVKLFITKDNTSKSRISAEKITVDKDGVHGDKFYAKEQNRAILISSTKSYEMAINENITIADGALGENILIDIDPYTLLPTQKIKIGEALFEITQNCTLCKGLSTLNSKLPKLLKDDRGIFVKYIGKNKHTITLGDKVELLA